jgi:hypothetical protein
MAAREDRKVSGTGHTVEVKSVSMTPESWRLLDELRGNSVVARRLDEAQLISRVSSVALLAGNFLPAVIVRSAPSPQIFSF